MFVAILFTDITLCVYTVSVCCGQPNHETGVEEVVEEVATFKRPSAGGNGKYELKDKYYAEYCPFFYHYSKSDQSKVR